MELNSNNMKKILSIVTFTILLYLGLTNFSKVVNIIKSMFGIISPFIIAICIAFVVDMMLRFIEARWDRVFRKRNIMNKIKRPVCILLSFTIIIGFVFVLIFMVVPEMGRTISDIAKNVPYYISELEEWWNQTSKELENIYVTLPEIEIDWKQASSAIANFLSYGSKSIFNTTLGITASIFSWLFKLIIALIFSIYILFQKENLYRQVKKLLYAYLKEDTAKSILDISKMAGLTFSRFVTGQLTEAVIIGVLCFIGMSIFSMPYAVMISALVGFTALIPLVGAFIGTAFGAFMIIMVSPIKALWFVIFIIVLQQLEGNIIYPKVVGNSVGLPGMWVLVAITIGGGLFGIVGMLLAVPISSVLYALLKQSVNNKLSKKSIDDLIEYDKENEDEQFNDDLLEYDTEDDNDQTDDNIIDFDIKDDERVNDDYND